MRNEYPQVALRRLLDLQKRHPGHAGITAQIGVLQADMGYTEDALKYLGMASSMEPNNAQHVFNMAIISDRSGNVKEAINQYEKALQVDAVYGKGRTIPRETIYDRLAALRRKL